MKKILYTLFIILLALTIAKADEPINVPIVTDTPPINVPIVTDTPPINVPIVTDTPPINALPNKNQTTNETNKNQTTNETNKNQTTNETNKNQTTPPIKVPIVTDTPPIKVPIVTDTPPINVLPNNNQTTPRQTPGPGISIIVLIFIVLRYYKRKY